MTEKEVMMALYIKRNVLPKLQEIQRKVFMDVHINMDVNVGTYKKCVSATFCISMNTDSYADGNSILCRKEFCFDTFTHDNKSYDKELRGISHFVRNWQERLA